VTLNDLLNLFPPHSRTLPRFMGLASALLSQVVDLAAVVEQMGAAFAPAGAVGEQLDALGATLGLERPVVSGNPVDDETYRQYIQKKLTLWQWDGTNGTAIQAAQANFPGIVFSDNSNGTVSATAGTKDLLPIPAGIRKI